jgi:peptidoglycan/xylan/chitin deacetylase (PgdA/CDA1 family)
MSLRACFLLGLASLAVACNTSSRRTPEAHSADASTPHASKPAIVWPNGARAAVSLTYDDALRSQLDHAVPALRKHALHGTFFLTGTSPVLQASPESYRALVRAGHELAAHTMNHPCNRLLSFVKPGMSLQDYDVARMEGELSQNIQQLRDLGQQGPLSFAYPCGSTWLGEPPKSYLPLVEKSFVAARGVTRGIADPARPQLFDVMSVMGDISRSALIDWVERAMQSGGWLVFTFHGVDGEQLSVDSDDHEALLAYLEKNKAQVWTERFGPVAQYVRENAVVEPPAAAASASVSANAGTSSSQK